MSGKFSSLSALSRYQSFTQSTTTTFNTNSELRQSKIQRWIFGMIIGSAPFFLILFCWIFVSLCVNNFVRFYHRTKKGYRHRTSTKIIEDISPVVDV
jgi:hypothetical protein